MCEARVGKSRMTELLIGVASALTAAVLTYFSSRSKIFLDLTADYDRDLRNKRLDAYRELWRRMEPLSTSSVDRLSVEIIKSTRESIRSWYFQVGGIYLSNTCRDEYDRLKYEMIALIDEYESNDLKSFPSEESALKVVSAGKVLRQAMAQDVATRKQLRTRR